MLSLEGPNCASASCPSPSRRWRELLGSRTSGLVIIIYVGNWCLLSSSANKARYSPPPSSASRIQSCQGAIVWFFYHQPSIRLLNPWTSCRLPPASPRCQVHFPCQSARCKHVVLHILSSEVVLFNYKIVQSLNHFNN
jgi:hypothetical protein